MAHLSNVLKFGGPYLRRYWVRLGAGVLFGILFGLSNGSFVWATKTLIGRMDPSSVMEKVPTKKKPSRIEKVKVRLERFTQTHADPWLPKMGETLTVRRLIGGILLLPILVALRGAIGYLSSYCMAWSSERMINDLRLDVMAKLSSLSLDFFNRAKMGDLLTRVHGDTAALQRCMSLGLSDLIKEPVTIVCLLGALVVIDAKLTVGAMLFFPLCVLPVIVLGKKVRRASKAGLGANIDQASLLLETLSGIRVVKAFGLEGEQLRRFRKLSREMVHHGLKGIRSKELVNPIIETISMFGLGAVIVYIAYERRSLDEMLAFLTGLVILYTPVKKLAGLHLTFEQASVGVARLVQILTEQPSVRDPVSPQPLQAFRRAVEFDKVSFSYGHDLVLRDVSLRVERGMKLGVAGESGSGKSTLVNLLFRFYDPTAGAIRIDGLDLREASLSDLRLHMALVSQEIVLFDQTVAENIAAGKPGASTRAEIEGAARAAYAHEFIQQLPHGYETRIGERGVTLSGGQRQRLAIARAFIRNAPILVLDEATASLDSQSEAEVQRAIDHLAESRTVISVAHRLSTLAQMDRIIVLSQGRMIESGTFGELLGRGGVFAAMARRQGMG